MTPDRHREHQREQQREHERRLGTEAAGTHAEIPADAHPSTAQPLNAEPRPRLSPLLITVGLVVLVVVGIIALTYLGPAIKG
jgi:hypothetical protein